MGKRKRDMGWETLATDVNQVSTLIYTGLIRLQPLKTQLDNADNFDDWYHDVVKRPRTEKLHRLIDKNFPRPAKSDDFADEWYIISQRVRKWLAAGISQELNQDIAALGKRTVLADEFMRQVKKALQVQSPHANLRRVKAFEAIKLSDYFSPLKYVKAVKVKFSRMYTISPIITPYYALVRILDQIDKSLQIDKFRGLIYESEGQALSDAMRTLEMRKHNSLVDKFTITDFRQYCTRMIEKMEEDELDDDDDYY